MELITSVVSGPFSSHRRENLIFCELKLVYFAFRFSDFFLPLESFFFVFDFFFCLVRFSFPISDIEDIEKFLFSVDCCPELQFLRRPEGKGI